MRMNCQLLVLLLSTVTSEAFAQPTESSFYQRITDTEISKSRNENQESENHSSYSVRAGEKVGGDFVFPSEATNFAPNQDVTNCSQDETNMCLSNVRDYPYHYIERVLSNTALNFNSYFSNDDIDISTRLDEDINEEWLCDSEETILYPKIGKTADNEVLFIINTDGNYKQGIRVEKCKKNGQSPCDAKLVAPTGYRTYCKQKYIYRKLLALRPNGELTPDNFRVPSCCTCYISSS